MPARASILIVEDNADLRETLADLLDLEGYGVTCAANGQEALTLLRGASLPHLILLDLMMPVMDGWALVRELAQDPQLAAVPVVIMSAVTDARSGGSLPDVAGSLLKPIDLNELLKIAACYCE